MPELEKNVKARFSVTAYEDDGLWMNVTINGDLNTLFNALAHFNCSFAKRLYELDVDEREIIESLNLCYSRGIDDFRETMNAMEAGPCEK